MIFSTIVIVPIYLIRFELKDIICTIVKYRNRKCSFKVREI